ncbi:MAG: DUF4873 domain-containing protein [Corynebacteriales bacterium]|nr:DUF4873 domain-containing protein [Mycobacteriales bacterium]
MTEDLGRATPRSPHDDSDYRGDAAIVIKGVEIPVTVEMKGYREPIDGIYRWIGRVGKNERLTAAVGDAKRIRVIVKTPHSAQEAYLGDPDFWDRFRINGKSTPPFAVATDIDADDPNGATA